MSDSPRIRLRIVSAADVLMGPGKADLLQGIAATGSIAAAGRRMGMSYKRAWYLIDAMNGYFREPLVQSAKGGKAGGGAQLTSNGERVLAIYLRMEAKTSKAVAAELKQFTALARSAAD